MSIKNLIPAEQLATMQRADPKELKKHGYLVVCTTCNKIFLETTLDKLNEEVKSGLWNNPQMWYVLAGRHWLDTDLSHKISVYQGYPSGTKAKRFCLTDDWHRGLNAYAASNKEEAMRNELNHLEKQIKERKCIHVDYTEV